MCGLLFAAGDEEYTSMRMTSVPRGPLHGRDRRYRPPSQEVRESVCKRLHQEREMKRMMGTVAVYVVYLACVYVIVFSHQDPRAFLSLQSVTHCVVEPQYEGDLPLLEVSSVDDMWEYLETTLVPNLYVTTVDGEQFLPDMSSKVLGVARLRQLRVNQGACVYRPLHPSILWRDECFGSYTFESEDTSSYNVSWKQAMNQTACDELPLPWTYQADTGAAAFMGPSEKWYSGAGYVVELSRDADQSLQILHDLQAEHWADEYTRAVFVEFTTFQPSTELFTVILIMFESLPTGNVLPFYHMMNSKLFFYHTKDLELNNFIVELLYIILMVGFSYQELKRFMGLKWKDYVQNPWSWMELAVICLSYASVAMFAGRVMTVRWTLDRYVETGPDSFTSFYAAALSDYLLTYILGTLLMLLTMKLVQLLQFTRRVLLLTSALYLSTSAMLGLVLLIGMMFMVFTGIGLLLMQPYCANLARVQDVVGALVYLLLLESPYDPEECIGSHITEIIAPIYFFVVGFTMMILWFPFLEAILDYGVVHIRKTHKQHLKDQYELLDFLKIKINGIFHSDKSKKGRRLSRIQRRLSRF